MNQIKKYFGILWLVLGPLTILFLIRTGLQQIVAKPVIDTKIQWGVFIVVFIPIAIGLMIFGYYSLNGEYSHLPENSTELED